MKIKPLFYSSLLLLISKDVKVYKVYTINVYRYIRSLEDKKTRYFITNITILD